jgi:hypothetical protein
MHQRNNISNLYESEKEHYNKLKDDSWQGKKHNRKRLNLINPSAYNLLFPQNSNT